MSYGVNVSRIHWALDATSAAQTSRFMDDVQNNFLRNTNAVLQGQREIRLGKYLGRSLGVNQLNGRLTSYARSYFTPRYMYQVTASVPTKFKQAKSLQIRRVLDSFRILPQ